MKKEQRERREQKKGVGGSEGRERERENGEKKTVREVSTFTDDSAAPHLPAVLELERMWALLLDGRSEEQRDKIESDLKAQVEGHLGPKH